MRQIIKTLDGTPLKIIRELDIDLLDSVVSYQEAQIKQQKRLEGELRDKYNQLEHKLIAKYNDDLAKFTSDYESKLQQKIIEYHDNVENKLAETLNSILTKLNINDYNNPQIARLIRDDLYNIISDKQIKIEYNFTDITSLLNLIQEYDYQIKLVFNDKLPVGMCCIEDSISIIYVNYLDTLDKIQQVINKHDVVEERKDDEG